MGLKRLVLLAVGAATRSDGYAEATVQALATVARVETRRMQQILRELAAEGVLEITPGGGRGRPNRYRVTFEMRAENYTLSASKGCKKQPPLGSKKGSNIAPFPSEKGAISNTLLNPAENCTLSGSEKGAKIAPFLTESPEKGALSDPLSGADPERGQEVAPFSPEKGADIAPFPGRDEDEDKSRVQDSSSSSPSSRPQSAVGEVSALLSAAGVPVPQPSRIGLWLSTLGDASILIDLLHDLVGRGLADKDNPLAYVHACVARKAQEAKKPRRTALAGADDTRRRQIAAISQQSRRQEEPA